MTFKDKNILIVEDEPDTAELFAEMMPDLSGLEVLRYIREDPDLQYTPVVIVSALGLLSDARTAFAAGADEYLTKPVSFRELKSAVLKVTQMEDLD